MAELNRYNPKPSSDREPLIVKRIIDKDSLFPFQQVSFSHYMRFSQPLIPATLIKRYKRFLADVECVDGTRMTVHTANTGAMLGCAEPGMTVWLKDTQNPSRKYRWSWDVVENQSDTLIGINTLMANQLLREAIESGIVRELQGYDDIKSEVNYGRSGSRLDFLLKNTLTGDYCFVEVKNVTASLVPGVAIFPDAVSTRASKHLEALMDCVSSGSRAVLFFCVQRDDINTVRPADEIDIKYGETLRRAATAGVEILAYKACVSPTEIRLQTPIEVRLNDQ